MTVVAGDPLNLGGEERPRSLVELVHRSVVRHGLNEALRWKTATGWASFTYAELWDQVARVSLGLRQLGVGAGDRVVILSRSRPEWVVADIACLALGAATCPIYPGDPPARMADITRRVGARVAIVEDARLLRRLVGGFGPEDEQPRFVLVEEGNGPGHVTLADLARRSEPSPDEIAGWTSGWQRIPPEQVATIVHTMGVDGVPLGVVVAHGNLLHSALSVATFLPVSEDDTVLSVLPMSHMFERGVGILVPLAVGACVVFADRQMERWAADMAAVRPTMMAAIPLFLERLEQRIRADVARRPAYARALFRWALGLGARRYAKHLAGRGDGAWLGIQRWVALRTVLAPARGALGGRLRYVVCGGAALPEATGRFFDALGLPIIEGYGLTESAPVLTGNRLDSYRYGTVGTPVPDTEIRLDPVTGEILGRGPQIMLGYLDRPDQTARALDAQGWLRTGDIGEFDEARRLRITGRIKNLLVLATGKNVAPAPIERAIEASPYIVQAVVLGDDRDAIGALLVPDVDAIRQWAGLTDAGGGEPDADADVLDRHDVPALLRAEVDRLTDGFASFERPRRLVVLPRPLSAEAGELDASGRPIRSAVIAAFPVEVADLFDRTNATRRQADRDDARQGSSEQDPATGRAASAPG